MKQRLLARRRWPLLGAALALVILAALPLAAQPGGRSFLPLVVMPVEAEPELAPQQLRIVRVVMRAGGPAYNSDEYVQVTNVSTSTVELGGLLLLGGANLSPARPYRFPAVQLATGASALIFSKVGSDNPSAGLFYMGLAGDNWRAGQVADLRDSRGRLLSRLALPLGPLPPLPTAPVTTPTAYIPPPVSVQINDIVLIDPAFPLESEEYVQIRNAGDRPVNLGGWRLINASRPSIPAYSFPSFILGVDFTIAVFSKVGEDAPDVGDFYWDQTGALWRVGDRAELRDAQNTLIDVLFVPNQ